MKPIFSVHAIVVCVVLGALPARATVIDIGVATQAGISNVVTEATGTGASGASLALLTYDNFLLTVTANDPSPIDLGSATLNISGGSRSPLYVYVTETGLVSNGSALDFQSQFGASVPSGWSETETTYVSTSNTAYGEGTPPLGSQTGSGTTTVTAAGVNVGPSGSLFSVTEVYEFISNGLGLDVSGESVRATASVQAAPAPAIGSGIPSMLAVGAMLLGTGLVSRWRRS